MTARSEWTRIEMLRAVLGGAAGERVLYGIGDDAAILAPAALPPAAPADAVPAESAPGGPRGGASAGAQELLVWTVDSAVEGVHFRRDLLSFEDLGYRATMAAASDLAAMGARPVGLLAALVLPRDVGDDELLALARGQRAACDALGAAIVGGNLSRGGEISITTTALGAAPAPLRRDGARPGDALALAGPVGLAAAGFALLDRGIAPASAAAERAIEAFRRPLARIEAGLRAAVGARAAIDISDGLAADLAHLARASGVRVLLDPSALVGPDLREAAALLGADALELALHGGEDYAVAVAGPGVGALPGFVTIGRCAPREEGASEVALLEPDGQLTSLVARGYDHFA
ncbi:thiamine-phosphate kinase [Sorangium cellulosum]|uniref:Thiamine-monophosphate kinase n=1 Tax=Sorangium cellulosum TaxID=56 RepID=A0A4P2PUE1_SORCE|nr:thiamine-phosphate kinase [Sorangium cellulosum]AUX19993.1 thiamine-phosphate kinase [Sorangium cellulosum]